MQRSINKYVWYHVTVFTKIARGVDHGTFNDIVSTNLDEIKRNFTIGLNRIGFPFDEDMFMDVGIKCVAALKNRTMTKQECIKYFWVAYNNTRKTAYKGIKCDTGLDVLNTIHDEPQTEPYNITIDRVCQSIKKSVKERFGYPEYNIWIDKIYNHKTYKDLRNIYGDLNYLGIFRKIKKYITQVLPNKNREYKELLTNLFES